MEDLSKINLWEKQAETMLKEDAQIVYPLEDHQLNRKFSVRTDYCLQFFDDIPGCYLDDETKRKHVKKFLTFRRRPPTIACLIIEWLINQNYTEARDPMAFFRIHYPRLEQQERDFFDKFQRGNYLYCRQGSFYNLMEIDVKSAYPAILAHNKFPKFKPIFFKDKLPSDYKMIYFVEAVIECDEIINDLNNSQYEIKNNKKIITTFLTSCDIQHLGFYYKNPKILKIIRGYKFAKADFFANKQIHFLFEQKEKYSYRNAILKNFYKKALNCIWGKFGQTSGSRYYSYEPISVMVNSYARNKLLEAIHKIGKEDVMLANTDSIIFKKNKKTMTIAKILSDESGDSSGLGKWCFKAVKCAEFVNPTRYKLKYHDGTSSVKFSGVNTINNTDYDTKLQDVDLFVNIKGTQVKKHFK